MRRTFVRCVYFAAKQLRITIQAFIRKQKITDMNSEEKLAALGLQLPNLSKPAGNYVCVNIRGNIAYMAIQFPKFNDEMLYKGVLGKDLTTEDGYKAMQLCAINVLGHIDAAIGLK